MAKQKIVYIVAQIDKALEFEWASEHIDKERFELVFILLNKEPGGALWDFVKKQGQEIHYVQLGSKFSFLKVYYRLKKLLRQIQPDIVHCHLYEATVLGLPAAKKLKIPHRIYTRHHSTLNHLYYKHAVKYDKYANKKATQIVAITESVKRVLVEMEGVNPEKITLIHHCLEMEQFAVPKNDPSVAQVREKYKIPTDKKVIGVISRPVHWKGLQYSLPAILRYMEEEKDTFLILANVTETTYKPEVDQLLAQFPQDRLVQIEFEKDIFSLYQTFDVFVHVPIDPLVEAFGQIYIETMAAGIPPIVTLSGIGNDICRHEENCLVVAHENEDAIYRALQQLLPDKQLQEKIIANGKSTVSGPFSLENKIAALEKLYSSCSN